MKSPPTSACAIPTSSAHPAPANRTLLFNLIQQDIENGDGVAVLDPHGDLIDQILGIIPEHRIDDVVLVDPSDVEFPVGFNILSAHTDQEKNLLASDLVSVFHRLSSSWGDQMDTVLQNAILAFLEATGAARLPDLRRFLIETPFRNEFLKSVNDSEVVYYWQKVFRNLTGGKSIGSVLTRSQDSFSAKSRSATWCRSRKISWTFARHHGQRQNLSGETAGGFWQ